MKKYSKSEQEVLDAVDGKKRLRQPALKRHLAAIEKLKQADIIEKDEDDILRRVRTKHFTAEEFGVLMSALGSWQTKNINIDRKWNQASDLMRKITFMS